MVPMRPSISERMANFLLARVRDGLRQKMTTTALLIGPTQMKRNCVSLGRGITLVNGGGRAFNATIPVWERFSACSTLHAGRTLLTSRLAALSYPSYIVAILTPTPSAAC